MDPMQTSFGGQVQPSTPNVNDIINLVKDVLQRVEMQGNFDDLNL